jgi:hypothetical protein
VITAQRRTWHDCRISEVENTELRLSIAGEGAEQHLRALFGWLGSEDELRGQLELRNRPIVPGQMGGVLDVLVVALGSGGAGTVLARSLSTWLTQTRADVTVTVTTTAEGQEVKVDTRRARDAEAVIRGVKELLEPRHPDQR